jgi:hypothetical protein
MGVNGHGRVGKDKNQTITVRSLSFYKNERPTEFTG